MTNATDRRSKQDACLSCFTVSQKRTLRRRLLAWYAKHARDLPWRRSPDPYRVWISEIMLQQTQVATVRDYFLRFVREFPTVRDLAAADEQRVLRLWEGMGYYRRARQLHAAAQIVVKEHDGQFPQSADGLRELPGIGRYTAGAIASIAFNQRAPILEANTIRLLSRLVAYRDDPLSTAGQRLLWQLAEDILPRKHPALFNQALMELGSLICRPTEPKCDACPLSSVCAAHMEGAQREIPRPKPLKKYTEVREAAIVVRRNGRVLMRHCAANERWTGLWDFPRCVVEAEGPLFAGEEIVDKLRMQTGITVELGSIWKTIKHGVTRYRITLDCYQAKYISGRPAESRGITIRWIAATKLAALPLNTTARRIATLVS